MPDQGEDNQINVTDETDSTQVDDDASNVADSADEGREALGDAGKKALDAMKAERKAARDAAAAEKARADALQAKLDGKEAEHQAAQDKAKAEQEALAKANQRILNSEVKAAAKGVLADPADAHKFLDLSQFEVDDSGNVDEAAINAALEELVNSKPYLAAQGSKFGNADAGTRKESAPGQLTRQDIERLAREGKHAEIEKARQEGRLNTALGIKSI